MLPNNAAVLRALIEELRQQVGALAAHPVLPESVKLPLRTSFQILDILVSEVSNDG